MAQPSGDDLDLLLGEQARCGRIHLCRHVIACAALDGDALPDAMD
ncbi:hypothetical protein ACXU4B_03415 [Dyella soli]|nr:hypothetical protein [Dyella soli]